MQEFSRILQLTFMAGLAMPLSAIDSIRSGWLENEFLHTVIAFGDGALFAAVSNVLVRDGAVNLSLSMAWLMGKVFPPRNGHLRNATRP